EPKVASARDRNTDTRKTRCGRRELHQLLAAWGLDPVRTPRRIRDSVNIVPYRENTRVVLESLSVNDVERPKGPSSDGPTRRTVTSYGNARKVFQKSFGFARLGLELFGRLVVNQLMAHTMTRDLVSRGMNLPYEIRTAPSYPTEDEERRLYSVLRE